LLPKKKYFCNEIVNILPKITGWPAIAPETAVILSTPLHHLDIKAHQVRQQGNGNSLVLAVDHLKLRPA